MVANAQLVLFAIQAGLKLYAVGRKEYVEATLDHPMILPLPSGPGITVASARKFFLADERGKSIAAREENQRIRDLVDAASAGSLGPEDERELTEIYHAYLRELHPELFDKPLSAEELKGHDLVAIMTVRQWSKGELGEHPSPLQRIAGTLVNIAVDYFAYVPGAISERRPAGRALKAFLEGVDGLDFADTPPAEIAGDLLIAVVDSVGTNPDLIGNTETEEKFIRNVAVTLSKSAKTHLENVPTQDRWQRSAWLQMIARALVKGSVDTVLADPRAILGVDEADVRFIQGVCGTIADLVIGPDRLRFQALLSGDGVNTVMKAALKAVAKNPEILRVDHEGLRNIIVGLADGMSQQSNLLTGDIFPALISLLLEKSAENLDLVWPEGARDPAKHLLLTATRQLFLALARGTHEKGWPTLTKGQILSICELVFDEIVQNPDWLLERADLGNDSPLSVAVLAALDSLRHQQGSRLSTDVAVATIAAAVHASALRLELLRPLPLGGADAGKVALSAAIDAIFESAFGDPVDEGKKWIRARNSTLVAVLEVTLNKLAQNGASQKQIDVLRREIGGLIDKRSPVEELGERLDPLLRAA